MYVEKKRWTARQVNVIRENYETMKDEEIAELLGRTLKSVRRKRERMGLEKACGRGVCGKAPEKEKND